MAIAFDAGSTGAKTLNNSSALTVAHTCTGSNGILWAGIAAGNGDFVSTVTYNGVSMSQAVKKGDSLGNNNQLYLYYLIAPATGTHDIVVTPSSSTPLELCAASYTGVKQSGAPDATASGTNGSTTSSTVATTTIADNCWVVSYCGLQRAATASTNVTSRAVDVSQWGTRIGDTNGPETPAGSISQSFTFSSITAGGQVQVSASFAPSTTSTGNPAFLLNFI